MDNLLSTDVNKPLVEENPFPQAIPVNEGPAQGYDTVGGKVASNEARLNVEADETGFIDATAAAFTSGGNMFVRAYKRLEREALSPAPDINFDVEAFIKAKKGVIPQHLEHKVRLADSEFEANLVVQDMLKELKDQDMLSRRTGVSTFVAQALAGIVDLDTPFSLGLGVTFKGGMAATKWGRYATGVSRGALIGGASLAAGEGISVEASTTGDWTSIPAAGLAGMAFGGAFGAFGNSAKRLTPEDAANNAIRKTAEEFDDFAASGRKMEERDIRAERHTHEDVYQTNRIADEKLLEKLEPKVTTVDADAKPKVFSIDDLEPTRPDSVGEIPYTGNALGSSVGARQLNPQGSVNNITNSRSSSMVRDATTWAVASGVPTDYFSKAGNLGTKGTVGDFIERQANRFHDAVVATGIATDFDRLFRSGSVVAQKLAYDTAESAAGIVRNNRSASMLKEHNEKQLLGAFLLAYEDAFNLHARGRGAGWYDRLTDSSLRKDFNRELALELNARMYDPPGTQRSISDAVSKAADAMDQWSALEIEIGRGRPGETAVKGYDKLQAQSGYMPQRWSSKNMEDMIRAGRTEKEIIAAIAETYRRMHAGMSASDALLYAGAVTKRARAIGQGIDTNLIGMLQQDGRDFVEDMLRRNGVSAKDASDVIDRLTSNAAVRGQAGQTKGRIDVDMRVVASNGIALIDLFDTDFVQIISRRSRGTAGAAALARKGIASRTDRLDIIQAILDEQAARGPSKKTGTSARDKLADAIDEDKPLTREDLEHYFSYFDGGPVAGGLSPAYANMKKLTNLALLNGLGLTQLAETGAMIASVGIQRWWEHSGAALKSAINDPKSALVRELKHINVLLPEDRLFRPDLNIEMDRVGTAQSELAARVSGVLNQGQRIQGITSGFYAVRNIQQRIAVTSAADKIMTNMKGLANDMSSMRAEDWGLDPATFARVKGYVDNGTVEFLDGSLHKLNFDKWAPEDVEDFALTLNRAVHQMVQKTMIGEDSLLFHRDGIAALFFHLKSFPMLAMEKQMLRHLKMADGEATASVLYGLATAGTAYAMKQALAGNTENASDPIKVAKGAFGMSNMTGWIPMWSDPIANMLGINSLKFNEYARGIDNNVMAVPAALTTLNRMANIPGAVQHMLRGEYSNNDVRALQSTPIIGNAYGFTALFNSLKHTPKSRSKERAKKRAAENSEPVVNNPLDEMVSEITE
jgi:hypothetical protein